MKFWKEQMGFEIQGDSTWITDKAVADLFAIPPATEFRVFSAVVPGSRTAQLPTGVRIGRSVRGIHWMRKRGDRDRSRSDVVLLSSSAGPDQRRIIEEDYISSPDEGSSRPWPGS